jgi:hypothetical protein
VLFYGLTPSTPARAFIAAMALSKCARASSGVMPAAGQTSPAANVTMLMAVITPNGPVFKGPIFFIMRGILRDLEFWSYTCIAKSWTFFDRRLAGWRP